VIHQDSEDHSKKSCLRRRSGKSCLRGVNSCMRCTQSCLWRRLAPLHLTRSFISESMIFLILTETVQDKRISFLQISTSIDKLLNAQWNRAAGETVTEESNQTKQRVTVSLILGCAWRNLNLEIISPGSRTRDFTVVSSINTVRPWMLSSADEVWSNWLVLKY